MNQLNPYDFYTNAFLFTLVWQHAVVSLMLHNMYATQETMHEITYNPH